LLCFLALPVYFVEKIPDMCGAPLKILHELPAFLSSRFSHF
jgi:hypothetical protein